MAQRIPVGDLLAVFRALRVARPQGDMPALADRRAVPAQFDQQEHEEQRGGGQDGSAIDRQSVARHAGLVSDRRFNNIPSNQPRPARLQCRISPDTSVRVFLIVMIALSRARAHAGARTNGV